ncbi:MAG: Tex-like N-terminal domain-containing protein [Nitrospirota bacterium]
MRQVTATVPLFSYYRKEVTSGLGEVVMTTIRDRMVQLRGLDKPQNVIQTSREVQGKLTDALKGLVQAAMTRIELEDIYLPSRPKRRTRAMIAKERGLESRR